MGQPDYQTKDFKVADLMVSGTGEWNMELISKLLPNEAQDILSIRPNKLGAQDSLIWLPTKNGEYSTKTGYFTALKRMETYENAPLVPQPCNWMKDIWLLPLPPKIRVFLWKIVRGALPLGDNLETRGITTTTNCVFCGLKETVNHMFLACNFATEVWSLAPIHCGDNLANARDFTAALQASKASPNLPPRGMVKGSLFPWIVWTIWKTRNQRVFENIHFSTVEVIHKAVIEAREWEEAQAGNNVESAVLKKP